MSLVRAALAAVLPLLFGVGLAHAQAYPTKAIHIITAEPGGINDIAGRLIAAGITGPIGAPVLVENRPGGVIAVSVVAKAAPDGYTLLIFNNSMWTLPLIQKTDYDPLKDFAPVTLAVSAPNVLVVPPSIPAKSVSELVALAQSEPGKLNYASGSTGGSAHLGAELFKSLTHTNIVRIPYSGGVTANEALLSGQVQMMFATAGSAMPLVKSGKLRALAVTSAEPSALTPGLPTVASTLPGYVSVAPVAIFAPAKTPAAAITKLNQNMVKVLRTPESLSRFQSLSVDVVASTPEQLEQTISGEMTRLKKVVDEAGIRAE